MVESVTFTMESGDFMYSMELQPDGTYHCERTLVGDPGKQPESLDDWAQLPKTVRDYFTQVQSPTA